MNRAGSIVHFGSYGTACLDTGTKQVLWKRDDLRCRHYRGPASSPILYKDTLILTMDGADLQYLVALDKKTGKTVWKTDRSVAWNDEDIPDQMTRDGDRRKAHSTPLVVQVKGKPMMLTAGAKAAYGYDPDNGRELWRVQYNAWSAAPVPVYDEKSGLALFITGLGKTELLARASRWPGRCHRYPHRLENRRDGRQDSIAAFDRWAVLHG